MRAFLESVYEARLDYTRLAQRIELLDTACTNITTKLTVYTGKCGRPDAEQLWATLSDERPGVGEMLKAALDREHDVETFIGMLDDKRSRTILRLRYLRCLSWPQVRSVLSRGEKPYSMRHIFRLHGNALNSARRLWEQEHERKATHDYINRQEQKR